MTRHARSRVCIQAKKKPCVKSCSWIRPNWYGDSCFPPPLPAFVYGTKGWVRQILILRLQRNPFRLAVYPRVILRKGGCRFEESCRFASRYPSRSQSHYDEAGHAAARDRRDDQGMFEFVQASPRSRDSELFVGCGDIQDTQIWIHSV
jgi:hypothetical protein